MTGYTTGASACIGQVVPPTVPFMTLELTLEQLQELSERVPRHLMGTPGETRHLVVRNEQAVISPSWSIHSGVGTRAYSFIWGMAGENQTFDDMDGVAMSDLR